MPCWSATLGVSTVVLESESRTVDPPTSVVPSSKDTEGLVYSPVSISNISTRRTRLTGAGGVTSEVVIGEVSVVVDDV